MFKRYFVPNLIGTCKQQHFIKLICLLTFIVGSQNVYSQQQIAQDAYAIFEQSCFICHGPTGSYKETLLIEHNALIQNGTVVPGNPDASELYNRLITTDIAKRMPLNLPPLSAQAIDTIHNWILAGAPDWAATSTTNGNFISPSEILNTIETHLMSLAPFDRAFARYFTMTHLYNAGEPAGILQEYRKDCPNWSIVSHGRLQSPTQNPLTHKGQSSTSTLRHYEWMSMTLGHRWKRHIPIISRLRHPHRRLTGPAGTATGGDEEQYTIGSYRLVSCKRIFTPTIPRTAFFTIDGWGVRDSVRG